MNLTMPYQITKMLGEFYCNFFHNHYELSVVKTRFFNSYGPGEVPERHSGFYPLGDAGQTSSSKSRLLVSIDRAKDLLGYAPGTSFQMGLTNTINWFRDIWDKIVASASFEPGMSSALRMMMTKKNTHSSSHKSLANVVTSSTSS